MLLAKYGVYYFLYLRIVQKKNKGFKSSEMFFFSITVLFFLKFHVILLRDTNSSHPPPSFSQIEPNLFPNPLIVRFSSLAFNYVMLWSSLLCPSLRLALTVSTVR